MLGRELLSGGDDGAYSDETHYSMRRPHKIARKDKLQYLQVRVESEVNKKAKAVHERHSRTLAFSVVAGLLALAALTAGITVMALFKTVGWYAGGGALIALSVVVSVVGYAAGKRLSEWEKGRTECRLRDGASRLKDIIGRIKQLTEDADGR